LGNWFIWQFDRAALHFHVYDKPDPLKCVGIPVNFSNITIQWADLPRPIQSGDVVIAK